MPSKALESNKSSSQFPVTAEVAQFGTGLAKGSGLPMHPPWSKWRPAVGSCAEGDSTRISDMNPEEGAMANANAAELVWVSHVRVAFESGPVTSARAC